MYALTREKGNLAIRRKAKQQLNERLKADGQWKDYCKLREFLKREGMPESDAWLVAGIPFPPKDDSPHELGHLPQYSEIVDAWKDGKWPKPPDFVVSERGITDFTKTVTEPTPEAKAAVKKAVEAPQVWENKWHTLSLAVGERYCDDLVAARWVQNYFLRADDPGKIEPESVPGQNALTAMYLAKKDVDFAKQLYMKLIPDRKSLELGNRFKDDGRTLRLLEEFQDSLDDDLDSDGPSDEDQSSENDNEDVA